MPTSSNLYVISLQEIEDSPEILTKIIVDELGDSKVEHLKIIRDAITRSIIVIKEKKRDIAF